MNGRPTGPGGIFRRIFTVFMTYPRKTTMPAPKARLAGPKSLSCGGSLSRISDKDNEDMQVGVEFKDRPEW